MPPPRCYLLLCRELLENSFRDSTFRAVYLPILIYALPMKSLYALKLFFAVALGVLSGQAMTRDYAKWHALGREAFLAAQANRFDQDMAHPASGALHIVTLTLITVALVAMYEVAAFGGAKCISLIVATIRER